MTSKSLVRLCVVGVAVIAGITAPQLPARAVVNLDNPALVTHVDSVENCPTNQARPIFRSQPLSQIVAWQGSNVTLTANVEGASLYQWRIKGTNIVGLSRDLVLTNVQPEQSGSYQLIAENSSGSVTSSPAALTVIEPGAAVVDFRNDVEFAFAADRRVYFFNGRPIEGTNLVAQLYYGSSPSTLVAVTNPPARFRDVLWTNSLAGTWMGGLRVLPGITPGSPVVLQVRFWNADSGQTFESPYGGRGISTTFSYDVPLPGAPTEAYYIENFRRVHWDPCAGPGARILEQPADVTAEIGTTLILSVVMTTTNPCFLQWQFNGTNLPGARSHRLGIDNVQPEHAGEYRVIVGDSYFTSRVARVTVVAPPQAAPIFRSQPPSQIVEWRGSNVTLTANVEGACLYQWRFNGTNVVGLSRDLVLTNVQPEQSGSYQLIAENSSGSVTSSAARLTVIEPGTAVVDFRNDVEFITTADRRVRFFNGWPLVGTNFGAQLFYGSSMVNLIAVTNPPARFRNVPQTDVFAGMWVGGLRALPGITPGSQIVLQVRWWDADWGETWESSASNSYYRGLSATFTYAVPPPGAPSEAYYIEGFRAPPNFGPCGPAQGSLQILEQPADVTAPVGTTVILNVATTNACDFQWQFNGTNLPAQNARFPRLRINGVQPEHAGAYQVIVRGTVAPYAITSQVARVTVVGSTNEPAPAFRSQPQSQIVWQGSNVTLTANVEGASIYQWRFNETNIVGLSRDLLLTNVQPEQSGSYHVIAANDSGSVTSSAAGLTVIEPGVAVVDFRNDVLFTTSADRRVSFTSPSWQPVVGTNFAAQLFYGLSSFNLVAVTNPPARFRNVPTTDLFAGTWVGGLRVLPGIAPGSQVLLQVRFWDADWGETWESVTNGVYKGLSTTFTYDVPLPGAPREAYYIEGFRPPVVLPCAGPTGGTPQILEQPADVATAIGTTVILSVATTNACLFQWQFNGTNLPSALFQRLRINSVQPERAGEYRLIARGTPPAGQPAYTTSRVARVTVVTSTNEPPPAFRSQPQSQIVWQGSNVTLTASVEGARSFQWRFNGTNVVGLSQDLVLTNVQSEQSGSYQLVAENYSGSVTSSAAGLTVIESGAAVVDFRNDVEFATTAERRVFLRHALEPVVGTNFAAQLYYSTNLNAGNLVAVTNPPARFRDVPPTDPLAGTWVGGLRVLPGVAPGSRIVMQVRRWEPDFGETFELATCPCKQSLSQIFLYDVPMPGAPSEAYYMEGFRSFQSPCGPPFFSPPTILEQPADVTAAIGTTVILSVNTNNACFLQWQFNGTNLPGARFDQLRISSVQRAHAGDYRVIVRNSISSVTSEVARVTVVAPPPQFASPAWSPNGFRFHVPDEDGREFVVETATNLTSPVWSPVSTNVAPFWFTNSAPSVDRQRFYRSILR